MMKTIVIGAGVMGASVAYRLAQAGAAVTVLEATRIGGGTSGISFAWTNAHQKPPKPYHDLNVAGMKAHAALADEFGATPWWHGGGSLEWEAEPGRAAQRENFEQLRSWGAAAEVAHQAADCLPLGQDVARQSRQRDERRTANGTVVPVAAASGSIRDSAVASAARAANKFGCDERGTLNAEDISRVPRRDYGSRNQADSWGFAVCVGYSAAKRDPKPGTLALEAGHRLRPPAVFPLIEEAAEVGQHALGEQLGVVGRQVLAHAALCR